MAPTMPA
jgi:hypothetical protein